ncbi:MAG: 50S ribosomal protein L18 [Candidatus Lokiarchaeota archaeon]|nr:50S ribosomal protein L18 [Candidatus Lokiarchaeota archaeon]
MGKGPRYRVFMRRRRESRTNYQRRLKMVLSGKLRLVIRARLSSVIVQIVKAELNGDKIIAASESRQLKNKFNWKYNLGNMPSAYLTGLLCGMRAKKEGVEECILDVGILTHKHRVLSAFKGFLDSGIKVNYNDKFFKDSNLEERIDGSHIEAYAKMLSKENKEKFEQIFSNYIRNKVDPKKIVSSFKEIKKKIEKV